MKGNIFTDGINEIALCSINSIEIYAYGTSNNLLSTKEGTTCNSIIKRYKND